MRGMIDVFLHGFGSSAALFRREWEAFEPRLALDGIFLDGFEPESLSGNRRWFPFSGVESRLASSVRECADPLEAAIADRLTRPSAIRLFGHSQGGMLALELACRGRLPIAEVHSFAAYLPSSGPQRRRRGSLATVVYLHSSRCDPYIERGQVERTIERLKSAGIDDVRDRVAGGLPHNFSADWLGAGLFAEATP